MTKRPVLNHGKPRWKVDFGKQLVAGKWRRQVKFFMTEGEADKAMSKASKDAVAIGKRWTDLAPEQRSAVVGIIEEVEAAGFTLKQVWDAFRIERLTPVDETKRRSIDKAIADFTAMLKRTNKRDSYIESCEQYLKLFAAGREEMFVDRFQPADIDRWFNGRAEALSTKAGNLGRLSSFFGFCFRRGYCRENICDRIERTTLDPKPPVIFKLNTVAKIMVRTAHFDPEFLGWITLALLAGMRPEEADKVPKGAIDLSRGTVRVTTDITKVRNLRIIHLTPAALEWLQLAEKLNARFVWKEVTRRRHLRKLRDWMKLKEWPQDILRHTAASHLIAHFEDYAKVASELGNSEDMLKRHYRELVEKEDGDKFVQLRPTAAMLRRALKFEVERLKKAA